MIKNNIYIDDPIPAIPEEYKKYRFLRKWDIIQY